MKPEIEDIGTEIPPHAVSVYNDTGADDFPVLKAFQQYIDAEQAKARKRLLTMGIFFGVLTFVVIAVFVVLLHGANMRNQQLNDRLIEFVMKDRDGRNGQAAVVVQPPVHQDNSALVALTTKLEAIQQKLAQSEQKADAAERARSEAQKAVADAAKKGPSKEELEIRRLKAQLAIEKEQRAAEAEIRRQEELDAYRRRHYPELYEQPKALQKKLQKKTRAPLPRATVDLEDEEDQVEDEDSAATEEDGELDDSDAIDYFKEETTGGEKHYSIPVDVRGASSKWRIP